MSHTVIEMNCPGCGARVSTGQSECEWCHKPIIISTFNSVYSMPMPEVNKYAGAYKKALSENPDENADYGLSISGRTGSWMEYEFCRTAWTGRQ